MANSFAELDAQPSGAEVLDFVRDTLTRYVIFPSPEAADAVTLYAAASYAVEYLEVAPRLVIKSPEKRCGKSRLLDLIECVISKPDLNASVSAASLARSIGETPPATIMLDEADATFSKGARKDESTDMLRGILNAGFQRGRTYKRFNAATGKNEDFSTFAFAVLAGIGDLPDTIEDRAVIVTLRRKAPSENVERFRTRRDRPVAKEAGKRLGAWVVLHAEEIGEAEPLFPDGLNDRQEDTWEPLLAVADLAGGDWPDRARRAAVVMCTEAEEDASEDRRLLRDLKGVFGDNDKMSTADILAGLKGIDDAPWGAMELTALQLSRMLRGYSVRPKDIRTNGKVTKGYEAAGLQDAWNRYVPQTGTQSATGATGATSQVSPVAACSGVAGTETQTRNGATTRNTLTSNVALVAGVAGTPSELDRPSVGQTRIATESNGSAVRRQPLRCDFRGCAATDLAEYPGGETYCGRHAETMGAKPKAGALR